MVKRGGTKRKAVIKKITDKSSKAVTFTKRRDGLFSKAAQLCILGDAQIAILATPSSSNSNVSFFSFGHSSVDSLVSAYLSGQRPVPVPEDSREMREDIGICMAKKELGLGYWWDDEKIVRSKDPQEIMQAMESLKILWEAADRLLDDEAVDFDHREGGSLVADLITTEDDQIISVCDSFFNYNNDKNNTTEESSEEWSDMDFEQLLTGSDFDEKTAEEEDHHQIEAVSENSSSNKNNNALLLPAAVGDLNDDDQNLLDLDLANVELDTIFGGLASLDAEFVASLLV